MDRPAGPVLRWVRACLVAAVSVGLAVAAHASAGGVVPGASSLAVVFAASAAVSAALLGRPASALRVAGLLVAGQGSVHVWLTLTTSSAGPVGMASMAGHDHGAMSMASGSTSGLGAVAATSGHMLVTHLVAAAGVGLWLALGERALWTVLDLAGCGVRDLLRHARNARSEVLPVTPLALALRTSGPAAVTDRSLHLVRRQAVLRRSVARRGPPARRSA